MTLAEGRFADIDTNDVSWLLHTLSFWERYSLDLRARLRLDGVK